MTLRRKHRCQHRHRTYRALAACIWRRAAWVRGEGPWAVLCRWGDLTVLLIDRQERAEKITRYLAAHYPDGRARLEQLVTPEEAIGR